MKTISKNLLTFVLAVIFFASTAVTARAEFYQVPGVIGLIDDKADYEQLMKKIRDPEVKSYYWDNQFFEKGRLKVTAKQKGKKLVLKIKNTDQEYDTGFCEINFVAKGNTYEFYIVCDESPDYYMGTFDIAYKKVRLNNDQELKSATEKMQTIKRQKQNGTTVKIQKNYTRKLNVENMGNWGICSIGHGHGDQRIIHKGETIKIVFRLK